MGRLVCVGTGRPHSLLSSVYVLGPHKAELSEKVEVGLVCACCLVETAASMPFEKF